MTLLLIKITGLYITCNTFLFQQLITSLTAIASNCYDFRIWLLVCFIKTIQIGRQDSHSKNIKYKKRLPDFSDSLIKKLIQPASKKLLSFYLMPKGISLLYPITIRLRIDFWRNPHFLVLETGRRNLCSRLELKP